MPEMTGIILNGYLGKMGTAMINMIAEGGTEGPGAYCAIVAGIDELPGSLPYPFPTFKSVSDCNMHADVIVDFSRADGVPDLLAYGAAAGIPMVICTTGLSGECVEKMNEASQKTGIFYSPNMSVGISVIESVIKKIAPVLNEAGFDIEIIERHHGQKKDAPSGTALILADAANAALGGGMDFVCDRSGRREKRPHGEIGLHAVRGGTIVGEHSVIFAGRDEIIELNHSARSRDVFAVGAIKAAKFMKGKPPGMYGMSDIMDDL